MKNITIEEQGKKHNKIKIKTVKSNDPLGDDPLGDDLLGDEIILIKEIDR